MEYNPINVAQLLALFDSSFIRIILQLERAIVWQNLRYLPPNSDSSLSSMLISRLRVKGMAKLKQIEYTKMQLK